MPNTTLLQALLDLGYSVWTAKLVYYEMLERVQGGEDPEVVLAEEGLPVDYVEDIIEAASEL
jgi:CheY-like chemotaxis protein